VILNYVDYIILLFLFIGFILGFKDGIIRKIIGFVGFILAIFLAIKLAPIAGKQLVSFFNNELQVATIVSGIGIFFLAMLIVSILKRILHPVDKVNKFVNQLLGGIAGSIQMIFFISALLIIFNIFNFPNKNAQKKSLFYKPFYNVLPITIDFLLGTNSSVKQYLNDYIPEEN